jgi:hypothetical protein
MSDSEEFALMDDPALFNWRTQTRAELDGLPPDSPDHAALTARFNKSTDEIADRARAVWSKPN